MQEIVLELNKVTLSSFDTKTLEGIFTLTYTTNGTKSNIRATYSLTKSEPIVGAVIQTLKDIGKIQVQPGDELVGSMFVIRLLKEEKIEELLYNFFSKLCEKARSLKRETNHTEYMRLYDDIRIQSLVL